MRTVRSGLGCARPPKRPTRLQVETGLQFIRARFGSVALPARACHKHDRQIDPQRRLCLRAGEKSRPKCEAAAGRWPLIRIERPEASGWQSAAGS